MNGHTAGDPSVAAQPLPGLNAFVRSVPLPHLTAVRRTTVGAPLADVQAATRREVAAVLAESERTPGPIAVTAGSRGIANVVVILRAVVAELRAAGWEPFVVPAMGSHGGGTESGQLAVLDELGITEQAVGAPLRATMAVDEVGVTGGAGAGGGARAGGVGPGGGTRVYVDRLAAQAGAVFVVGRVKAHTDVHGPLESGPAKMLAVGLGHLTSAAELHAAGPAGLRAGIGEAARLIVARGLVVGALAVVENEVGQTAHVQGLRPGEIAGEAEERLLDLAKALMPRLPLTEARCARRAAARQGHQRRRRRPQRDRPPVHHRRGRAREPAHRLHRRAQPDRGLVGQRPRHRLCRLRLGAPGAGARLWRDLRQRPDGRPR